MAARPTSGAGYSRLLLWCSPSHTESNPAASARSHSAMVASKLPPLWSGLSPNCTLMILAELVRRPASGPSADFAEKRSEAPLFEDLGQPAPTRAGEPIPRAPLEPRHACAPVH